MTLPTSTGVSPRTTTPAGPSVTTTTTSPPSGGGHPVASAQALAECRAIGGNPVEGQDNWYILGPTYIDPTCKDIPYLGPDGATYYINLPIGPDSIEAAVIAYPGGTFSATEQECDSGDYPEANPGVNTPGHWSAALGLCLAKS